MELEEAKEQLKSLKKDMKKDTKGLEGIFVEDIQAISKVLQELDRLQKENEELKKDTRNRVIGCRDLTKKCKDCNLKECIGCEYSASDLEITFKNFVSKDKIKDCLDDIENYFENVSVPYEDIEFIKEKRNDLLKEE